MAKLFEEYQRDQGIGFTGMKADTTTDVVDSYAAGEGLNPGDPVQLGSDTGTVVKATDPSKIVGVVLHVHKEPKDPYYAAGEEVDVMSFGDVYVAVAADVKAGQAVGLTGDGQFGLAGNGSPAVAGSRTYTVATNFAADDSLTLEGVTLSAVAADAAAHQFVPGRDAAATAGAIVTALKAEKTITDLYTVAGNGAAFTLTEKTAGEGHTPGDVKTTGTGKVTADDAVSSTPEASADPADGLSYLTDADEGDIALLRVRK